MAEPKLAYAITRLLNQTQRAAMTIMVATHQGDGATSQLRKGCQSLTKRVGQPKGPVHEISKDDEHLGLNSRAEIQQWIQRAAISIARQGNAMSLKHFGFAQMQVSNQKLTAFWTPESLFSQKLKTLLLPAPRQPKPFFPSFSVS